MLLMASEQGQNSGQLRPLSHIPDNTRTTLMETELSKQISHL